MRNMGLGNALNEVGWEYADNDIPVSLNVFEVAMLHRMMESQVDQIIAGWTGSTYQKDWAEIYLELSKYIEKPLCEKTIERLLYSVTVSEGDSVVDIVKRNPNTPDIWQYIKSACDAKHLTIDTKTGTLVRSCNL